MQRPPRGLTPWGDLVGVAESVGTHLEGGRAGEGLRHSWEGFVPRGRDMSELDGGWKGTDALGTLGCRISPDPQLPPAAPRLMHLVGETEAQRGEEPLAAGVTGGVMSAVLTPQIHPKSTSR